MVQRRPPVATPAQQSALAEKLDRLARHFGQGETYSRRDQALILHGIVPEWALRVARLSKDVHMRGHAANLIEQLEILRKEGFPEVKYETGEDEHV